MPARSSSRLSSPPTPHGLKSTSGRSSERRLPFPRPKAAWKVTCLDFPLVASRLISGPHMRQTPSLEKTRSSCSIGPALGARLLPISSRCIGRFRTLSPIERSLLTHCFRDIDSKGLGSAEKTFGVIHIKCNLRIARLNPFYRKA